MGFIITLDEGNELETVHMDKQILGFEISTPHSTSDYVAGF